MAQRLLGGPAVFVLVALLAPGCVGSWATHGNATPHELDVHRELNVRPPDLINNPKIRVPGEIEDEVADEAKEKPNKIGLFLGGTHKAGEDGASIGLEYGRRLSDLFGVGLLLESTPSLRELVLGAPALFLHPVGELGVMLAPGIEGEGAERVFLVRVGLSWDFDLARGISLAPEINDDFVDGSNHAFIYGVTLACGF